MSYNMSNRAHKDGGQTDGQTDYSGLCNTLGHLNMAEGKNQIFDLKQYHSSFGFDFYSHLTIGPVVRHAKTRAMEN